MSDQKVIDREFGNLLKIKDNFPKFVISSDKYKVQTYEGIKHLNIIDFLMSDKYEKTLLRLPFFYDLKKEDIENISNKIKLFYENN